MSETSSYKPPKFLSQPFPGDKGYELVSKSYNRFIWTWQDFTKKYNLPKGDPARPGDSNESDTFNRYTGMTDAMGSPDGTMGAVSMTGYRGPLKDGDFMCTDDYMDPDSDEYKKMSKLISFEDFE